MPDPPRRRRRIEHRHRRPLDAEPGPARRSGPRLHGRSFPTRRSPSSSTPRSGTAFDSSEVPAFDEAVANAEIVSPPAGAFGRGDAFLLRIAEKVDADVLSNDSFQEFHGEHEWLFDRGRLIGGKPVPGIGWIFTARSPVRGPKSREAMRKRRTGPQPRGQRQAIKTATDEATSPTRVAADAARRVAIGAELDRHAARRRARRSATSRPAPLSAEETAKQRRGPPSPRAARCRSDPVNEPMVFLGFVASHRPGATRRRRRRGVHEPRRVRARRRGAVLPAAVGDGRAAAPRRPRRRHQGRDAPFVVQALDPPRRGIEIALPEFAQPVRCAVGGNRRAGDQVDQEEDSRKARAKKALPCRRRSKSR